MAKTPPSEDIIASWCAEHQRRATPLQRFAIRIDGEGQWWHEGARITRDRLSALFAGVLARLDGRYVLVTPAEWGVIEVEDVPYLITAMVVEMGAGEVGAVEAGDGVQVIRFTDSHGAEVVLDAKHPLMMRDYRGGLCPYVTMRPGLEARINRTVYYQLAEYLTQDDEGRFGVWSAGVFHIMDVGGDVAGEVKG